MQFVDTHCHIQEATASLEGDEFMRSKWHKAGKTDPDQLIDDAKKAGVTKLLCVGTTLADSKLAVQLVQERTDCWATIGIHPHESEDHNSKDHLSQFEELADKYGRPSYVDGVQGDNENRASGIDNTASETRKKSTLQSAASTSSVASSVGRQAGTVRKVVAVGECGLDYYYNNSPKKHQIELLEFQLNLAQKHELPLVFHVRDAFDEFLAILSHFEGVRGVVHSFTANKATLDKCLDRGLYIGLNGIMTFTKDEEQLAAAKAVPLDKLLLETDAPFLTPTPYRGTICEPKHVRDVAEFLSSLRGEPLEQLAAATTQNAERLFNLN